MNRLGHNAFCLAFLGASFLVFPRLSAQIPDEQGTRGSSNGLQTLATPAMAPPLPPVPVATSRPPVALFRELLETNRAERLKLLADRSPENQKLILAKLKEYEQLPPDERALRLRVTELRYYLWRLMSLAPSNRADLLTSVPADLRKSLDDRLRKWDVLPPDLQKELKENQAFVQGFTESADGARVSLTNMPPARAEEFRRGLARWLALPEEQRQRIIEGFNQYFTLTPDERDRTLKTLSEPERKQIENTLAEFRGLSARQRSQCLHALDKFATLNFEQRRQFFKNVDQWQRMTPSERKNWRDVVERISMEPPLPQELPPLPSSPRLRASPKLAPPPPLATNGG